MKHEELTAYLNTVLSDHESDSKYLHGCLRKLAEFEFGKTVPAKIQISLIWFRISPSLKNFIRLLTDLNFELTVKASTSEEH